VHSSFNALWYLHLPISTSACKWTHTPYCVVWCSAVPMAWTFLIRWHHFSIKITCECLQHFPVINWQNHQYGPHSMQDKDNQQQCVCPEFQVKKYWTSIILRPGLCRQNNNLSKYWNWEKCGNYINSEQNI
jgi:hypothetical protein